MPKCSSVIISCIDFRYQSHIQKYIEDLLADQIVNNKIQEGDIIEIHYNKDDDFLNVKTLSNKKDK